MTRKALGRGLSSLLREIETVTAGLEQVLLNTIDPNPFQPRRDFPQATLQELADSIRATGVLQPVLLRRAEGRYQLVAGERRWRAARLAGLEAVPAVVRDVSDREALELSLTENVLREDLNALEIARGYQALHEKFHLTHEEIAGRLGLSRAAVSNTLRLLTLPSSVQELLASGALTAGHARALLGLESAASITELAQMTVKQGLSVRQVEGMVNLKHLATSERRVEAAAKKLDPNLRAALLELERTLGTRVRIVGNEKRGRIEVQYFSAEDLNRLYEWIVRK